MSKIAFVKDLHTRLGVLKPLSRSETFHEDMKIKYESLRDKLQERGVTHLIFTGDIFDIKAPSRYDINAIHLLDELFLETLGEFERWTIRGNHDMFMTREGQHKNSIFELGITHNWYKTLEGSPLILDDIVVFGIDYRQSVDELQSLIEEVSDRAIEYKFTGRKTAIVVHEHLVPNTKDMFLNSYILYDWFTDKNFDIVVGGHLHKGYKTQEIDGVTFINPWSFTRLVRDHYAVDDNHKPCFSYIDIQNGELVESKTIAVKHKPYDKAFTTTVVSEHALIGNIHEFKAKIASAGSIGNIDIEVLREASLKLGIELNPEKLSLAIGYIEGLISQYEN